MSTAEWIWVGITCYIIVGLLTFAISWIETGNTFVESSSHGAFWPIWLVLVIVKLVINTIKMMVEFFQ